RRLKKGWALLGFLNEELIATVTLIEEDKEDPAPYYLKPGVFHFSQFAVDPQYQKLGYGETLLRYTEELARERGARELALDTAEPALHLRRYYERLGYKQVGYADFKSTNYRSVVLAKSLSSL